MAACEICGEDSWCDKSCRNETQDEWKDCKCQFCEKVLCPECMDCQNKRCFESYHCRCDEEEEYDPYEGEEPCSCIDGTINPICRWCFG